MNQTEDEFTDLPRALAERLAAQERSLTLLTPQVDEAVRRAAAAHFATRDAGARRARTRRWAIPAAAAAAAVLLAVLVTRPQDNVGTDTRLAADDVDGSGRVDILDAFALARARAADPGRVTPGEVDALAARIVSLRAAGSAL